MPSNYAKHWRQRLLLACHNFRNTSFTSFLLLLHMSQFFPIIGHKKVVFSAKTSTIQRIDVCKNSEFRKKAWCVHSACLCGMACFHCYWWFLLLKCNQERQASWIYCFIFIPYCTLKLQCNAMQIINFPRRLFSIFTL